MARRTYWNDIFSVYRKGKRYTLYGMGSIKLADNVNEKEMVKLTIEFLYLISRGYTLPVKE